MFVSRLGWRSEPEGRCLTSDDGRPPLPKLTESILIKPTVGRVVLFYPGKGDEHFEDQGSGPFAATVCAVHSDFLINVVAFNEFGESEGRLTVTLVQDDDPTPAGAYATWMPYQIGQAKKHEAA